MKGGITSGVVYPLAVVELAKHFRLTSIGGSSAGAIAASAAAAAERGRQSGGFDKLAELPKWLGETSPGSDRTNLFCLFQPQASTRALYRILTAPMLAKRLPRVAALLTAAQQMWRWAVAGIAIGASIWGLMASLLAPGARGGWAAFAVLVGVVLSPILVAIGLWRHVLRIPGNGYGLCSGMHGDLPANAPALTEWLTAYLNRLAGKQDGDAPLTFGELWWPDLPAGTKGELEDVQIRLEMMTTCVSHGRPYQLPFRDDDDVHENAQFAFSPSELRALFPESVVRWMVDHPRQSAGEEHLRTLAGHNLVPMPDPHNLPVVVAARMSLSFPFLLSMLPLWVVDYSRDSTSGPQPRKCWFSDGGMCSNFPVHLFDSPLPRWPTFAINLRDVTTNSDMHVFMVTGNESSQHEIWLPFDTGSDQNRLSSWLISMLKTIQNWNDNSVARLPGQRDRIAHVPLRPSEGGLNLNMPSTVIEALAARGRDAGLQFVERFGNPDTHEPMNWSNHRWIRLRSLLNSVEEMVRRIEQSCAHPQAGDEDYESWLGTQRERASYGWVSERQFGLGVQVLADLRAAAASWGRSPVRLSPKSPRPRPVLRVRPRM